MGNMRYALGAATLLAGVWAGFYLWGLLEGEGDFEEIPLTLLFEDSEGLHPGAAIRFRGVRVGEVRRISLGADGEVVEVRCAFRPQAAPTLRADSRFWIVRPIFEGIAQGARGLDTLIKDSYIAYSTPSGDAPRLEVGARVPGLSGPPGTRGGSGGAPSEPGDLQLTVYFAESFGLFPGSAVRYRGVDVGVVTSVRLVPGGRGVEVRARIQKSFRTTVEDDSVFWVSRPGFQGSVFSGLDVRDLDTLIFGTALTYHTPDDSPNTPVKDEHGFVGLAARPEFKWPQVKLPEPEEFAPDALEDPLLLTLVQVTYTFVEHDFWSADDPYRVVSPGVIFRTSDGVVAVLVARSGVDGTWIAKEKEDASLRDEVFRVTLPDGSVSGAGRVWFDPNGADLALLRLAGTPRVAKEPLPDFLRDSWDPGAVLDVISLEEGGRFVRSQVTLREDGTAAGSTPPPPRSVLFRDGLAVGLIGTTADDGPSRGVAFSLLPEPLRGR